MAQSSNEQLMMMTDDNDAIYASQMEELVALAEDMDDGLRGVSQDEYDESDE